MNEKIRDKIKGLIYGQAIGDALGLATEFMSIEEVNQFYPNGVQSYSDIIQDKHRIRWEKGDWTDDTDQILCIMDSIIKTKKVDSLDIASFFMNGLNLEEWVSVKTPIKC